MVSEPKPKNPMDPAIVLAYACKHGYMDIANMAAPLTFGVSHAVVVALLTPVAILPYVGLSDFLSPTL